MIQGALFDRSIETEVQVSEEERLSQAFESALRSVLRNQSHQLLPPVEATFYPYVGLSSTIRLRNGRIYARVSDLLRSAPSVVLSSLACILIAKLYRRRVPVEQERIYRAHTHTPSVVSATDERRRTRGFKITNGGRGRVFDLDNMFDALNTRYFGDQMSKPVLSWGKKSTRRVLGHHDHVHDVIVLSPSLDNERVPAFVVEYVLYHEMLHVKHKARVVGNRTVYHSGLFRLDERKFEAFKEATKWLEVFASSKLRGRATTRRGKQKRYGTKSVKRRL